MANFEVERSIIAKQNRRRMAEVWADIYSQRQPINNIEACVTGPGKTIEAPPASGWKPFEVHDRWGGFDQTTWFRMTARIPASMKGQRVVALVHPGGESLAYVNGVPTQGLDNNRDAILLTPEAKGGETFEILLESVPSTRFDNHWNFDYADIAVMHPEIWDFFWDVRVAGEACLELPKNDRVRMRLFDCIDAAIKTIDIAQRGAPPYYESIRKAQKVLHKGLREFSHAPGMGRLILTGHSHIDTAWLWPLRETKRKCGRTFSTVLNYMRQYPDYRFSCSQPVQYEWIKEYFPALFSEIKQRVKEGRWEPNGCFWVEPDLNVPSGESLVRQAVYGNRFFHSEFGVHSRVAWLPDTFGYCWGLPQILKKAQVDYFVTSKIHWNQFTTFPYTTFRWEGTDGSQVMAVRPWDYNGRVEPKNLIRQWEQNQQKDRCETFLFPFGWGDGGGGPTPEMLEEGKRLADMPGVPRCEFGTVTGCLEAMAAECPEEKLPVWNGELFFELHRGCQTTQARTKRNNRKLEILLHEVEFLNTLAMLHGGVYEQEAIYGAWKNLLTNQFHDILPGTSITEVYQEADTSYAKAFAALENVRERALHHLAAQIDLAGEGRPLIVINALSWARDGLAEVQAELPEGPFHVVDASGEPVACQVSATGKLLLQTNEVPPLGYAVYRILPGDSVSHVPGMLKVSEKGIENAALRVKFDKNGHISSCFDKLEDREVLPEGTRGNVLQMFEDMPCDWEAWDIDFNFEQKQWGFGAPAKIKVVEKGPLRGVVRFTYKTERSTLTQDVVLTAASERIEFQTHVDWHEKRTLLKAAFPVDVRSSRATYEIQFGAIERPTHRNRDSDLAQFEAPAQRWADLSEGGYGVSLLNDCKYGYDITGNVLRLSLLRSPTDPDATADEGEHRFTYALYPHQGDWRCGTAPEAAELNTPLQAYAPAPMAEPASGALASSGSLAHVDADHVVLDTVKRAEDSNAVILRLYEAYGQRGPVAVTLERAPKKVTECDLMEENDEATQVKGNMIQLYIKPFELRTFKVVF